MHRTALAALLASGSPAARACRRAVLAGAAFQVYDGSVPAAQLARLYARRQQLCLRRGIPTVGHPEAVAALRGLGNRRVRMCAVRVDDPPYHYLLLLDDARTAVVGVLGVDRRLGYRLRPGDPVFVAATAVGWADRAFPGWIRVRLVDATGRAWHLVDKVPAFDADVTGETVLPAPVAVHGVVTGRTAPPADGGPPLVVVSTAADGVAAEDGTAEFTVAGEALRRAGRPPAP